MVPLDSKHGGELDYTVDTCPHIAKEYSELAHLERYTTDTRMYARYWSHPLCISRFDHRPGSFFGNTWLSLMSDTYGKWHEWQDFRSPNHEHNSVS